nr:ABC transporter ATP-binding protein [Dethiosulfatibacter aminovorans]
MRGARGGFRMGAHSGPAAKANDTRATLHRIGQWLVPYRLQIIIVLIFAVLSSAFSIIGPKMLGKVTTKLIEGLLAYYYGTGLLTDFDYMRRIVFSLVILYIFSAIFAYIQGFIMTKVAMDVSYELRDAVSKKMHKLPLNYYDTKSRGDVLSRITNDIDLISQTLNQSLSQLVTSVATVIGIMIMMLSISFVMTLASLTIIPLSFGVIAYIFKHSQKFFKSQQRSIGELNGHVEETYSGHVVVKAFGCEEDAIRRFDKINESLYDSAWKSQFISGMMMPIMRIIGNLGYVLVSILGGYLAIKHVLELGDIQAFIQYVRNFTRPISQMATISNTLQSTIAASERVFEFLDEDNEVQEKDLIQEEPNFKGEVMFKNVSFGYLPDQTIIKDFSAVIEAGQKVAIVGPTGAGKTTIMKLLMRFYDIDSGQILLDGYDIYDFSRERLRNHFGMVLQDTWLYNASILENIRYGTFDATEEEVIEAAKAAHCDEFIRTLPHGYHMMMNEESSNISQGQKQLFTIARVILANPKVLILDEATSSVDTRTESLIQKTMTNVMKGRTSFVIAHRLSTIKDADVILVLKDGDIIEQGNHEELLAKKGFYEDLYNSQFAYEDD